MKRWIWFASVVIAFTFARTAMAQDDSRGNVFAGYSYARVMPQNQTNAAFNANGGDANAAYNITPRIAAVADFGGYKASFPGGSSGTIIDFIFGPRVSFRPIHEKMTPFVQALFGGGRIEAGNHQSNDAFAMTVGGGLDYSLTSHISIRPVQAEFFLTRFNDGHNTRQLNFRYSAGIVYRF